MLMILENAPLHLGNQNLQIQKIVNYSLGVEQWIPQFEAQLVWSRFFKQASLTMLSMEIEIKG